MILCLLITYVSVHFVLFRHVMHAFMIIRCLSITYVSVRFVTFRHVMHAFMIILCIFITYVSLHFYYVPIRLTTFLLRFIFRYVCFGQNKRDVIRYELRIATLIAVSPTFDDALLRIFPFYYVFKT